MFKGWQLPAERWPAEAVAVAAKGITAAVAPIAEEGERNAMDQCREEIARAMLGTKGR